jgi:hypothetical protein
MYLSIPPLQVPVMSMYLSIPPLQVPVMSMYLSIPPLQVLVMSMYLSIPPLQVLVMVVVVVDSTYASTGDGGGGRDRIRSDRCCRIIVCLCRFCCILPWIVGRSMLMPYSNPSLQLLLKVVIAIDYQCNVVVAVFEQHVNAVGATVVVVYEYVFVVVVAVAVSNTNK